MSERRHLDSVHMERDFFGHTKRIEPDSDDERDALERIDALRDEDLLVHPDFGVISRRTTKTKRGAPPARVVSNDDIR